MASTTSTPYLMMETHSLETAFNLRRVFSYGSFYNPKEVKVMKETQPLKVLGEYALIYFKTDSPCLMKSYFGDIASFQREIHILNFANGVENLRMNYTSKFFNMLISTYHYLMEMNVINQFERNIYLKFVDGDKVFILIESNHKATQELAISILHFLENSLQTIGKVS